MSNPEEINNSNIVIPPFEKKSLTYKKPDPGKPLPGSGIVLEEPVYLFNKPLISPVRIRISKKSSVNCPFRCIAKPV